MDYCPGQFCSNKIMKIFKTEFFENSFNKKKSVGLSCTKKDLKFALVVELAQPKFTYITVLKQPKLGHIQQRGKLTVLSRSSGSCTRVPSCGSQKFSAKLETYKEEDHIISVCLFFYQMIFDSKLSTLLSRSKEQGCQFQDHLCKVLGLLLSVFKVCELFLILKLLNNNYVFIAFKVLINFLKLIHSEKGTTMSLTKYN